MRVLADAEVQVAVAVARRASTLPPPSISVSVEGARSAEPPTISGTSAAAHWMTSCEALRVAIMPASGPLAGTSAPKPSGSRPASIALELGGVVRVRGAVALERLVPVGLHLAAAADALAHVVERLLGHEERLEAREAVDLLGEADLLLAQR